MPRSMLQPPSRRGPNEPDCLAPAAEAQLLLFRGWSPRPGSAEHVLKAVSRCKWPDYGLLLTVGCCRSEFQHSSCIRASGSF